MRDEERAMLAGWQRGDEQSVRAVFGIYYPKAVGIATLSGLTVEEAQDCAQDAFVHAFARRAQLRDVAAFPLWFHRIVTRRILDALTAPRRACEAPLEHDERSEDWQRNQPMQPAQPEEAAILAEQREDLWRLVQALPPRYRVPLVLRYYVGFSSHEIADLLNMREGTVRVTLHRALAHLRQQGTTDSGGTSTAGPPAPVRLRGALHGN